MTLDEKVELVRNNVISAVNKYKNELVGRRFLYIFGDQCIELIYKTENFMHLTGVGSKKLDSKKFYEKTKDKTLKRNHMFFSSRNPLKTALEKSNELSNIDIFSNSKIFVIEDMETSTYTYAFGFSDKRMTLGMTKDTIEDADGNEIELDYYVPRTFRVKEDATEGKDPSKVVEITMILSKTDAEAKYNRIHYGNRNQIESLVDKIKEQIDENLIFSKSEIIEKESIINNELVIEKIEGKEIETTIEDEITELDKNRDNITQ